jgi:uncharacterized protein (DUF2236 family)
MMAAEGYFGEDSVLRRVHRERVVGFSGGRALLMQAAHPVAFEGFYAHTSAQTQDAIYRRLGHTAEIMNLIFFGPRAAADEATAMVRGMHARARGRLRVDAGRFKAGTPFAADDPDLLLWVLATLADSSLVVYEKYVASLSAEEREAYWQDFRVIGRLFGLADDDMPATVAGLDAYMTGMLEGDVLHVTPSARELAVLVVLNPPVPLKLRPVLELINQITIGLLPGEIRRGYGLAWDPARAVALHGGAEWVRRVLPLLPAGWRAAPGINVAAAA